MPPARPGVFEDQKEGQCGQSAVWAWAGSEMRSREGQALQDFCRQSREFGFYLKDVEGHWRLLSRRVMT